MARVERKEEVGKVYERQKKWGRGLVVSATGTLSLFVEHGSLVLLFLISEIG